jgi:hypothetical protein
MELLWFKFYDQGVIGFLGAGKTGGGQGEGEQGRVVLNGSFLLIRPLDLIGMWFGEVQRASVTNTV